MSALWLRQVGVMIGKELRQLVRDRVLFAFVIFIFTGNIVVAGGELGTELHHARLVVHDADHSAASRELIHRFRPPYFHLAGEVARAEEGARMLDRGTASVLLAIPPRCGERHAEGGGAALQLLVDATQPPPASWLRATGRASPRASARSGLPTIAPAAGWRRPCCPGSSIARASGPTRCSTSRGSPRSPSS
jgi:ABC-2 type transport system permease protein